MRPRVNYFPILLLIKIYKSSRSIRLVMFWMRGFSECKNICTGNSFSENAKVRIIKKICVFNYDSILHAVEYTITYN